MDAEALRQVMNARTRRVNAMSSWLEEATNNRWKTILDAVKSADELYEEALYIKSVGQWTDVLDSYARQLAERLS